MPVSEKVPATAGAKMKNPWTDLPSKPPYVLPDDRPFVEAFNHHYPGEHKQYWLDLALFPQPFVGNRQAELVILNRNPGIAEDDHKVHAEHRDYVDALRTNLADDPAGHKVVGLLPQFTDIPAGKWWAGKCVRSVITETGRPAADFAGKILGVEFHGYHSKSWRRIPVTLPSQRYGFELVEKAIERGATIVVMRGRADWEIAVPRLLDYPNKILTRTARSSTISRGNCEPDDFDRILRLLDPTTNADTSGARSGRRPAPVVSH